MKKFFLCKLAVCCLLALGVANLASAQSTTQGAISGTVLDASDAAIADATVVIRNEGTGAELTLQTNSSGLYRAPQLAPGTYTVTVTFNGFNTYKTTGVVVQVQNVTQANVQLQAGSTSQSVDVVADIPAINFDSAQFGGHLSNTEIEAIPINNRRWSTLALTTPGVVNDANGFGLLSFRAISSIMNNVQIDGADNNQAFFSEERGRTRAGYSTSQAAVREFQVNTGVYPADFGRAVGGVVNSVTKSGSNQLHGELYFYNRNSSRSAFQPFASNTTYNSSTQQYVTTPYRPKDNRNQIGFGVGGPLIRDRLFWFYAFDTYRRNFPGTAKAANPGSFFVNIAATSATATTLASRMTLAGIPTTAAQAATLYNTQLQNILTNLGSVPRYGDQDINTPKLDWQINQKHHFSILYHRLRWDSPGGVQTQGTNNYAIDSFGTDFVKLDYSLAKLDSLITSNISNEVRYQYGRELNNEGLQPTSAYTTANLINNTGLAPEINLLGSSTGLYMGMPYYSFRVAYPDERKWQVSDVLNISFGKHTLRVGEDIVHNYDLQNNVYEGNGFITYASTLNYFSDLLTKANGGKSCNSAGSGVGGGTPATNYPCYSSYAAGFGPAVFQMSTVDYGFFAQDDWKLLPNLTLNLGIRYDYESFPQPFAGISGTAGGTLAVTSSRPSDKNNISPRVGFAWDPFNQGKTVLRGGFGLYYGRIANAMILNAYENTGSSLSQSTPSYSPSSTLVAANNLPTLGTAPTGPAPGTTTAYYLDPHLQNPYTEQFDLAFQQDLGNRNVLTLAYLGALGRELPNFLNVNLNPANTYNIVYNIVAGANGSCGPTACGTYTAKAYGTPNLNTAYGSITDIVSNINSNYHALSLDVTNRTWKWITFDANYTWSHALDFNQSSATAASVNNWVDPYANARSNYGTSSLNVRHRAVGWAVINLPGTTSTSNWKWIANGWSVKPLIQMQSGLPYSVGFTGSTPRQCYNSSSCLAPAGSGITGTSVTAYIPFVGRNTMQLPRTIVVDTRVQKEFALTEKYRFQIFGEAFNLANHRNVTGVNSTGYTLSTNTTTNYNSLTYNSATFSSATSANSNYAYSPRLIQITGRLVF